MEIQLCENSWTRSGGWEGGFQRTCAAIRQVNALGKMSAIATGTKNWATNSAKALRKRTPRTIIMGLLHAITMRGF